MPIETDRLRLRAWREHDRGAFADLNADPVVMADLGGPLVRESSDAKLDRYIDAFRLRGYGRWLVETRAGSFLGYCGVMPAPVDHPIGQHVEIGWRLRRDAWGKGYATEAAHAALTDAFRRVRLTEVLAYTSADNHRSQAVMRRLRLRRDASRDFEIYDDRLGRWRGLVWATTPGSFAAGDGDMSPPPHDAARAVDAASLAEPQYMILGMSLEHILRGIEAIRAPMVEIEAYSGLAWATWHEAIQALVKYGARRIGLLTPFDRTGNEFAT